MMPMFTSFAQAGPTQVRHHAVAQRARFSGTSGRDPPLQWWWHRRVCTTGVALRMISIFPETLQVILCHVCWSGRKCCMYHSPGVLAARVPPQFYFSGAIYLFTIPLEGVLSCSPC